MSKIHLEILIESCLELKNLNSKEQGPMSPFVKIIYGTIEETSNVAFE